MKAKLLKKCRRLIKLKYYPQDNEYVVYDYHHMYMDNSTWTFSKLEQAKAYYHSLMVKLARIYFGDRRKCREIR